MQKGDNSRSGYTAVNMAVVQSNFGATASYGFEWLNGGLVRWQRCCSYVIQKSITSDIKWWEDIKATEAIRKEVWGKWKWPIFKNWRIIAIILLIV